MIEEAAVLVIEDDQKRFLPLRARRHRIVDRQNEVLAILDVGGWVVVVLLEAQWVEVPPTRVDPRDRRQRAAGGVFQKGCRSRRDPPIQFGLPGQVGLGEVREPVVMASAVEPVGQPQAAYVAGVPAPGDAMRVEVPHERRLVVDRWQVVGPVIAASGGPAGQGVQAIRPGRSRNRTEPAITDGKLAGEMVVNRDVRGTVVTHDRSGVRVFSPAPEQRRGVAGHEAVHFAAAKLQVDGVGGVVGVPGDDRAVEMADGIAATLVLVGQARSQTVDVTTATFK